MLLAVLIAAGTVGLCVDHFYTLSKDGVGLERQALSALVAVQGSSGQLRLGETKDSALLDLQGMPCAVQVVLEDGDESLFVPFTGEDGKTKFITDDPGYYFSDYTIMFIFAEGSKKVASTVRKLLSKTGPIMPLLA